MAYSELEPLDEYVSRGSSTGQTSFPGVRKGLEEVLGAFGASTASSSSTLLAISEAFAPPEGLERTGSGPFSSARKWSAENLGKRGAWLIGAPEVLLEKAATSRSLREEVKSLASTGMRVLLLAKAPRPVESEDLPDSIEPAALLLFEEQVRPDTGETLQYFTDQGVAIKVISGDNPTTVAVVAHRAGVPGVGEPVDARGLPEGEGELAGLIKERAVSGRVTPGQKEGMVAALQANGHVVAMTGDGVNDVLALKKADIGIAMGSGSAASKAVAELVLLDGRFATMHGVVAEGRRVIGNIERVANLFLAKTVCATLLSIMIGLAGWAFIFLPRHLTLVSGITIGVPALVLSFSPNAELCRPGFVSRFLKFAVPAGLVAALAALAAGSLSQTHSSITLAQSRTMATMVLAVVGLWVLGEQARPFNWWKATLVVSMVPVLLIVVAVPWLREFCGLVLPSWQFILEGMGIAAAAVLLLELAWRLEERLGQSRLVSSELMDPPTPA